MPDGLDHFLWVLKVATGGELNMLEQPEYSNFRKLLAKLS